MNNRPFLQRLALACIKVYQRHLSPLKGYACAFRVLTGRDSCSAYGYRVVARHGLLTGLTLLRRRMRACASRYRRQPGRQPVHPRLHAQAGFCDGDIACDVLDLCDCCGPRDIINGAKSVWRKFRRGRPPLQRATDHCDEKKTPAIFRR